MPYPWHVWLLYVTAICSYGLDLGKRFLWDVFVKSSNYLITYHRANPDFSPIAFVMLQPQKARNYSVKALLCTHLVFLYIDAFAGGHDMLWWETPTIVNMRYYLCTCKVVATLRLDCTTVSYLTAWTPLLEEDKKESWPCWVRQHTRGPIWKIDKFIEDMSLWPPCEYHSLGEGCSHAAIEAAVRNGYTSATLNLCQ